MRRGIAGLSCWCAVVLGCGGDETEADAIDGSSSSSSSEDSSTGDPSPTTDSSGTSLDTSSSSSESSSSSTSLDTSSSSSSDSSSGDSSGGDSSSDSSTSDSSSSDSSTDASVSTQPTSASSSTGETDSATETDGDDPQYCLQQCSEAADCCPQGIDDCPGQWPWNYECVDGICRNGGCSGDDDCAIIQGTSCESLDGFMACVPLCNADSDCLEDVGETCSGVTDDGETFCLYPGGCRSDDDCQGFGVCDSETGACVCDDATVCPKGYDCAPWP
jgi:hypothetical protein